MSDQTGSQADVWPSHREMNAARGIMLVAVFIVAIALLRHFEKIFDIAAVVLVGSACLLYRATRLKEPRPE